MGRLGVREVENKKNDIKNEQRKSGNIGRVGVGEVGNKKTTYVHT